MVDERVTNDTTAQLKADKLLQDEGVFKSDIIIDVIDFLYYPNYS